MASPTEKDIASYEKDSPQLQQVTGEDPESRASDKTQFTIGNESSDKTVQYQEQTDEPGESKPLIGSESSDTYTAEVASKLNKNVEEDRISSEAELKGVHDTCTLFNTFKNLYF